MRSNSQVMLFPIVLYVLNGMCLISRCNEVPVYMQQGFIDEDIKLPLPLDFPSKTIFWKRENKIFGVCLPAAAVWTFFLCSRKARGQNRMDCRTFEGESNCFQVQTGVTRDLPTTVAFLEK